MRRFNAMIGIDPDVDKSGVAVRYPDGTDVLTSMNFWELFDYLNSRKQSTIVYLEAGWLNKGIYSTHPKMSPTMREKIAKDVGINHGVGLMIEQMLIYLKMPYKLVRPTQSKIKTQKLFNKTTGWSGRSSQEQRDAFMLIWGRNF